MKNLFNYRNIGILMLLFGGLSNKLLLFISSQRIRCIYYLPEGKKLRTNEAVKLQQVTNGLEVKMCKLVISVALFRETNVCFV